MKSKVYSVRLKEDFALRLQGAHPEGVSTYIRRLVEREAFRSHKGNHGCERPPLGNGIPQEDKGLETKPGEGEEARE